MNNDTQSINPYSNKGNNNSNTAKKAGIAAGVVGAAGIGTAAAYAATHDSEDAPIVEPEAVVPEEETPISGAKGHADDHGTKADDHGKPAADPADKPAEHPADKPAEDPGKTTDDTPGENGDDKGGDKSGENGGGTPGEQGDKGGENGGGHTPEDQPTEQEIQEYDDNNLDPDKTVDEVLADEAIDHQGDGEATGEMIIHDYEEVSMIYGEDGEAQMAAVAYDPNGNPIMLVDVDGDQMFDNGYYEDGSGVDVSALAINVGDAEYDAAANDEYLANNGENVDNFDGNDFSEDIIS